MRCLIYKKYCLISAIRLKLQITQQQDNTKKTLNYLKTIYSFLKSRNIWLVVLFDWLFCKFYKINFKHLILYFCWVTACYCSDPLEGGGTIYSTGFFFVPWIFAARYIHRRELRLVSLESSSSVEYGIKKIFLIFDFYRELSRFKVLRKEEWIHVVFIHIFRNFCLNFRQFC